MGYTIYCYSSTIAVFFCKFKVETHLWNTPLDLYVQAKKAGIPFIVAWGDRGNCLCSRDVSCWTCWDYRVLPDRMRCSCIDYFVYLHEGEKLATFKGKCVGNYSHGASAYRLKKTWSFTYLSFIFGLFHTNWLAPLVHLATKFCFLSFQLLSLQKNMHLNFRGMEAAPLRSRPITSGVKEPKSSPPRNIGVKKVGDRGLVVVNPDRNLLTEMSKEDQGRWSDQWGISPIVINGGLSLGLINPLILILWSELPMTSK